MRKFIDFARNMSDNESSDDEWYARMEAEGAKHDDACVVPEHTELPSVANVELSDDEYFTMIENAGSSIVEGSFRSEGDVVWQSMLRNAARGDEKAAKSSGLMQLQRSHFSSVTLCQQWLFGFLPKASKQFMELELFGSYLDENHLLFTDNAMHPSIVASVWTKYSAHRIEVSLYSPFTSHELGDTFPALFDTLEKVRRSSGLNDVAFCGLDQLLYENSIRNQRNWDEQWVENCGMFICERSPTHLDSIERSWSDGGAGRYFIDDLRYPLCAVFHHTTSCLAFFVCVY